jgi:hypothetical protein
MLGACVSLGVCFSTQPASAEPLDDLARVTQRLAVRATEIKSGDPITDFVQALVTIANVLNTTAPQITQFFNKTEDFYPRADLFIKDFDFAVNTYGPSWITFANSFNQLASILISQAPEILPKISEALDAIKNISKTIDKNSDPFMQNFGSATTAISTVMSMNVVYGVIAGAIGAAWCLKYEELGKYVFTLDPEKSAPYQLTQTCGKYLVGTWKWGISFVRPLTFRNGPGKESGGNHTELGIELSDRSAPLLSPPNPQFSSPF